MFLVLPLTLFLQCLTSGSLFRIRHFTMTTSLEFQPYVSNPAAAHSTLSALHRPPVLRSRDESLEGEYLLRPVHSRDFADKPSAVLNCHIPCHTLALVPLGLISLEAPLSQLHTGLPRIPNLVPHSNSVSPIPTSNIGVLSLVPSVLFLFLFLFLFRVPT